MPRQSQRITELKVMSSIWKISQTELPIFFLFMIFMSTLTACQPLPPKESGHFRDAQLVDLTRTDPELRLDIRYATTNNFTGKQLYHLPLAFLQQPAAEALLRAHKTLRSKGFGLIIYDGYRPWSVTQILWEVASPSERELGFVANPEQGSKHNRGCAVDVGIYDLATGREVPVPSGYDEFTERAYPDYAGGSPESRHNRDMLRQAMAAEGFEVSPREWWHYDYKDWRQYGILNIPFEDLPR